MSDFEQELQSLLNRNCKENGSGTPDFILANYMSDCLSAFNAATNRREAWYGREQDPKFGTPLDPSSNHLESNRFDQVADEVLNVPPNTHDPETGKSLQDKVNESLKRPDSWCVYIEQVLSAQAEAIKDLQRQLEKLSGAKEKGMKEGTAFGVTPVQTSPGHWEVPD